MLLIGCEKFRPVNVDGYEDTYEVGNYGTLRNIKTGKVLSKRIDKKGYARACLIKNHKRYERHLAVIVGRTFPEICGEYFDGCEADHINGWRNDDRAVNIRFVSHKENINNNVTNYRYKRIRKLPQCKIMSDKRKEILRNANSKKIASIDCYGNIVKIYNSITEAALETGCSKANIGQVANNRPQKCKDGKLRTRKKAGGYYWKFI